MLTDRDLIEEIDALRPLAYEVIDFVHGHPELGHAEHECSAYLAGTLARGGYEVERGVGDMPTAFRARLTGVRPGRTVGIVVLYDAVPAVRSDGRLQATHSCGHGPMSGGVTAAALALAALRERMAGEVVIMGCPADEIHAPGTVEHGGGKALSAAAGLWDDVDVALYAHPERNDTVTLASLWMRRERATVSGQRSLRANDDQRALVALRDLGAILDRLPPDRVLVEEVHARGDVEEGAGLVLDATFLVFGDDERTLEAEGRPLRAALPEARWTLGPVVCGVRPNDAVTAAVASAFAAAGRGFVADPPPLPFATDFGNISQRVPAALIGIGRPGGWGFHTDAGAQEFAGPAGREVAVAMAQVLALSTARLVEPGPGLEAG
ncbi:MAG: M20/M25/M40 family metallo-hydrolase [Solirubrobacteraceae bacterium]|nr:M20/M25/M40 family metallo-hydrolase [Solirubrobacteraceae bacterium]